MSKGVSNKIAYKEYIQDAQWLLPPSLDELVPKNHYVRLVNKTIDELEIEKVFAKHTKGGVASRYHPAMMLKLLVYSYMTGIYSSRQIAKLCRENVNVMWLTGFQIPDFRTINRFRSEKLKNSIEEIFTYCVKL